MPWVKLDDQIAINPKIERASWAAIGLWALALGESGRRLTDGVIEQHVIQRLAVGREDVNPLVHELLTEELWAEHDAGFLIPDYLEFNPSRAKVLRQREEDKERKRRERAASEPPSNRTSVRTANRTSTRTSERPSKPPDPDPGENTTTNHSDTQDRRAEIQAVVDGVTEAQPAVDPTAITTPAGELVDLGLEWPHILATILGDWPTNCRNPTGLAKARMAKMADATRSLAS